MSQMERKSKMKILTIDIPDNELSDLMAEVDFRKRELEAIGGTVSLGSVTRALIRQGLAACPRHVWLARHQAPSFGGAFGAEELTLAEPATQDNLPVTQDKPFWRKWVYGIDEAIASRSRVLAVVEGEARSRAVQRKFPDLAVIGIHNATTCLHDELKPAFKGREVYIALRHYVKERESMFMSRALYLGANSADVWRDVPMMRKRVGQASQAPR